MGLVLAHPIAGSLGVRGGNARFPFLQQVVLAVERYRAELDDLVLAGHETRELEVDHEKEHAASLRYRHPSTIPRCPPVGPRWAPASADAGHVAARTTA